MSRPQKGNLGSFFQRYSLKYPAQGGIERQSFVSEQILFLKSTNERKEICEILSFMLSVKNKVVCQAIPLKGKIISRKGKQRTG